MSKTSIIYNDNYCIKMRIKKFPYSTLTKNEKIYLNPNSLRRTQKSVYQIKNHEKKKRKTKLS